MSAPKTAIVVGAGLGGLATALRLAHAGYRVTVLERRDGPGGRCHRIEGEGFAMDAGPTLLVMRDVLDALLELVGERTEDHLQLRRLDPNYVVRFADGEHLSFHPDPDAMAGEVDRLEPGAGVRFKRLLSETGSAYRAGRRGVLERNFKTLFDYVTAPIPPNEAFGLVARGALDAHLGRYFNDRRLKDAFGFQTLYLGMSPYDSPALYAMLAYLEIAEGIWYPQGGMASIPRALAALCEARGVELRYGADVARIETRGARATAVRLADESRLEADVVVLNADVPVAYDRLLPGEAPLTQRFLRVGASVYLLYLGIEGQLPDAHHHNIHLPADTHRAYRTLCQEGAIPDDLFLYVCSPSVTEPALAPPGCQTLYALTMVPHLGQLSDWAQEGPLLRERMLDRLREAGYGELRGRIRFERRFSPQDFRDQLQVGFGAPFGYTHHLNQVGYFRPHNRHTQLGNVYFVGANTHPGGGVPMVLLSAKLVSERIAAEQGR
ncbi:phytoene desaturase [bacterium]|nr:phytoene desaturase [bacterium]